MRSKRFSRFPVLLVRASLVLAGASALTGCSSDVTRFQSLFSSVQPQYVQPANTQVQAVAQQVYAPAGVDASMSTGSIVRQAATPVLNQAHVVRPVADIGQTLVPVRNGLPVQQPLYRPLASPAVQQAQLPVIAPQPAPVTVARTPLLAPVAAPAASLAKPVVKPVNAAPQIAAAPVTRPAALAPATSIDTTTTAGITPASAVAAKGWSAANGTRITMREGETVYNLSRRFGVPASEILRANGIEKAGSIRSGQELIIPSYQYGSDVPVSAPDSNAQTAMAKSTRGTVFDVPDDRVPAPTPRPGEQVAVLPVVPQPKTRMVDPQSTGSVSTANPSDANAGALAAKLPVDQPLAVNPGENDGRYKVVSGDSLYAIAKKTGVSVGQLRAANGLTDKSVIKVGQVLNLPGSTAGVEPGADGVDGNITGKRTPAVASKGAIDATTTATVGTTSAKSAAPQAPATATASKGLRWPVQGKVVTAFRAPDNGKANDGIDIDVPEGTAVKAAEGGTVIYSGAGLAEFGNTVLIRHDNGLVTVYGHADQLKVQRNQRVNKGDVIALSGKSGKTSKPKLHFEVRKNSVPVDPTRYLE